MEQTCQLTVSTKCHFCIFDSKHKEKYDMVLTGLLMIWAWPRGNLA